MSKQNDEINRIVRNEMTKYDLAEIAMNHPIVHTLYKAHTHGHITYEQMLLKAVLLLAQQNNTIKEELYAVMRTRPIQVALENAIKARKNGS